MMNWKIFLLLLLPAVCLPAPVKINSDFPGGNIVFERMEGDDVFLHQDLRDTNGDWFYWYFAVTGAQGRELTFHFTQSRALGVLGPGVSTDGGVTWRWLNAYGLGDSFTYKFAPDEKEVRFSFGMPYTAANLKRFLDQYTPGPYLSREILTTSPKGRQVEKLRLGRIAGGADYKVFITVRHHSCEMMVSYVAEGIMAAFLDEQTAGIDRAAIDWLRDHVELMMIPFVDKDGVEDGDQGKNRIPHDHQADYRGESIYAETAAIRQLLPIWTAGQPILNFDLHDPTRVGTITYSHGLRKITANTPKITLFLQTLEDTQTGPLNYQVQDCVDFAVKKRRRKIKKR